MRRDGDRRATAPGNEARGTRTRATVVLAALAMVVACRQEMPTGIGGDQAEPVTIEIELPWSEFAANLAVFGGYGVASELGRGVVANQYAGTLDARTLVRFGGFPTQTLVVDSTGTNRVDSLLTIVSGRLVARFDTIASTNAGPVDLAVGALQNEWQARTVSWTNALDTINDQRAWPEPGGGPVVPLGTATWDPSTGDSVSFLLDSAGVSLWTDTLDLTRGARLELVTGGERLQVTTAQLRVTFRPSIDPDTLIELPLATNEITFIYDPFPQPPPDGIRIGGTPSWRTVLDVDVPSQLSGPAGFCAVVSCPHTVEPGQISYAALVLTSRASDAAFQPTDSVGLDVRTVLLRSALPKSPLGPSLVEDLLNGRRVRAEAFGSNPGERVEIPITPFARALLADSTGTEVPSTLALLSVFEPLSIAFASFHGPGTPDEPRLRLVLTIGPPVELP